MMQRHDSHDACVCMSLWQAQKVQARENKKNKAGEN